MLNLLGSGDFSKKKSVMTKFWGSQDNNLNGNISVVKELLNVSLPGLKTVRAWIFFASLKTVPETKKQRVYP